MPRESGHDPDGRLRGLILRGTPMRHLTLMSAAALLAAAPFSTAGAPTVNDTAQLTIDRLFAAPNLDGAEPKGVKISPDSRRVTFLQGKATDRLQQDLWEYNLDDGELRLLVDSATLIAGPEQVSAEELARRERLRQVGQRGIVSYQFSPDGSRLLFPLGGDLYLHTLATGETRRLTDTAAGETDPKFSTTGRYVSFVRAQNLYVIDLETFEERAVTADGGGLLSYGVAEFVAQEEMYRFTGYWWSPDDSLIALTRVDEAPVEVAERFEIDADGFRVYEQRYPATGTANADVTLGVAKPGGGKPRWFDLDTTGYLARVDWFPDGKRLAVQWQSRDQQALDLLAVDVRRGSAEVLVSETSDTWINLNDDLTFLEDTPHFLWVSERDGHAHVYLYQNDGTLVRQLSAGNWDVVDGARARRAILHVDETAGVAYVTGTLSSPRERNVYALALDGDAQPRRVTPTPGWHQVDFAPDGSFYVDSQNSTESPPSVGLYRPDGTRFAWVEENALDDTHPYAPYLATRPTSRFGTLEAGDGQLLHYRMMTPPGFDPDASYPAVVYVYGGPHGQNVENKWQVGVNEILARNGYIVFTLDNRGTSYRGVAFDAPIHRRMGHVEVEDQMVGVDYLRSLDYVDADRIGVWGWSYGGYMTLMCLLLEPEAFAVGVSGAPVTDWALYDTHYTERYLGTPQDNADGYLASSVFPYVENLAAPLLLVHGMADDNVLYTHSTKLYKALQDAGKPFDIMAYPGSKHGLSRVPETGSHFYAQLLRYLDAHLKRP